MHTDNNFSRLIPVQVQKRVVITLYIELAIRLSGFSSTRGKNQQFTTSNDTALKRRILISLCAMQADQYKLTFK